MTLTQQAAHNPTTLKVIDETQNSYLVSVDGKEKWVYKSDVTLNPDHTVTIITSPPPVTRA